MSSDDLIREAQNPATPPARLAEIAQADRSTWPAIVFNPAAYDGLLQWLGERGDPTVDAALAARAAQVASLAPQAPPAPVVPPAPVAETPVEAEPVEAEPVAETPVEEPATEPTAVIPTSEPTAVFPAAAPVAATQAFGSVPPGGTETHPTATDGGSGSGKPLGVVIAMVAVIIALVGGAAYGATQVFGGDDDSDGISALDSRTSDAPDEDPTASAPDTSDDSDDSGSSSGASGEFCSTMEDIQDSSMDMLDSSGTTPDLDDLQDMASEMTSAYKSLEASAPDDLKDELAIMGDYFDLMMNPTADSAAEMSDSISEYAEAAQKVGVYYAQNCL